MRMERSRKRKGEVDVETKKDQTGPFIILEAMIEIRPVRALRLRTTTARDQRKTLVLTLHRGSLKIDSWIIRRGERKVTAPASTTGMAVEVGREEGEGGGEGGTDEVQGTERSMEELLRVEAMRADRNRRVTTATSEELKLPSQSCSQSA